MCGIFGIIQKKYKKFDKRAFITLGVANDRRGKDSCGIFIDQFYEYGVDKKKLFVEFFKESVVLNTITDAKVILGHCRKASVGVINEKNAQPVVIKNQYGSPDFVLIHNGTIYNYKDLAKKYIPDIDITGMTDSQVMAHIFYYKGYNVLKEYIGGGMFVMYDLRTDKVFMFKGASLLRSTSTEATEERPCYFVETSDGIVFSSIYEELSGLYFNDTVYILPENELLTVYKGELRIIKKIDRSKQLQSKPVESYVSCINNYYQPEYIEYNKRLHYYMDPLYRPADGIYYVSSYGQVSKTETNWFIPRYFYKGNLLYDKKCYDYLNDLKKREGETSVKFVTASQLMTVCPIVRNGKMYKVNYETFKVEPCRTVNLPLCCLIMEQKDEDIQYLHKSISNSLNELPNSLFEKFVNYVESIQ